MIPSSGSSIYVYMLMWWFRPLLRVGTWSEGGRGDNGVEGLRMGLEWIGQGNKVVRPVDCDGWYIILYIVLRVVVLLYIKHWHANDYTDRVYHTA